MSLFAKLNARQFALHSNWPNLIFSKCITYTVLVVTFTSSDMVVLKLGINKDVDKVIQQS